MSAVGSCEMDSPVLGRMPAFARHHLGRGKQAAEAAACVDANVMSVIADRSRLMTEKSLLSRNVWRGF